MGITVSYNEEHGTPLTLDEVRQAQKRLAIHCPACSSSDIDDNGESKLNSLSFCCNTCGEQFDAVAVRKTP